MQARCEAKRKEMMLSWEKNKARAKEAALEKERSSPSAMTRYADESRTESQTSVKALEHRTLG